MCCGLQRAARTTALRQATSRSRVQSRNSARSDRPTKQVVHIDDIRAMPPYLDARSEPRRSPISAVPAPPSPFQCSRRELIGVDRHLSPGGAAVHRQANRAGRELRRAGRHRDREHPPAQRAARIAAAADRHRRRAQGHQPLDLRSADGARYTGRVGGAAVRGGHGQHLRARGALPIGSRELRLAATSRSYVKEHPVAAGSRTRSPARVCSRTNSSCPRRLGRSGVHDRMRSTRTSATFARCSAFRCCAKERRSA